MVAQGTASPSEAEYLSHSHIVVVDDDAAMRSILRDCFEAEDYRVSEARNSAQLMQIFSEGPVDLITLDIGLGTEDGMDIARKLRDESDVGIIMVTGKEDVIDKVLALEMGADDYITKPFNLREVIARVKSVLRRQHLARQTAQKVDSARFMFGGWILDRTERELVTPGGKLCALTASEFDLLELLVSRPNRVLSRDEILAHTRGPGWVANDRVVDNQVGRLRRKMLEANGGNTPIRSVRGLGYMLAAKVTPVQDEAKAPSPPHEPKQG